MSRKEESSGMQILQQSHNTPMGRREISYLPSLSAYGQTGLLELIRHSPGQWIATAPDSHEACRNT